MVRGSKIEWICTCSQSQDQHQYSSSLMILPECLGKRASPLFYGNKWVTEYYGEVSRELL